MNHQKTIISTIRQIITQWVKISEKENPKKYQTTDNQALINQLKEHNRTLKNLLESANKVLDQEQQLHAVSQKNVENLSKQMEAQRLLIEESQRPKPLLARLKAAFVTNFVRLSSTNLLQNHYLFIYRRSKLSSGRVKFLKSICFYSRFCA